MRSDLPLSRLPVATVLGLTLVAAALGAQTGFDAERLGQPLGFPVEGAALETMTDDLASIMRCPVCQGLSVADSPVDSAVAMKNQVRELLAAGYTRSQVLEYFEASYGEFILLEPKATGFNLVVWIAPVLAVLAGALLIVMRLRKPAGGRPQLAPEVSAKLEAYRDKVRREVSS